MRGRHGPRAVGFAVRKRGLCGRDEVIRGADVVACARDAGVFHGMVVDLVANTTPRQSSLVPLQDVVEVELDE